MAIAPRSSRLRRDSAGKVKYRPAIMMTGKEAEIKKTEIHQRYPKKYSPRYHRPFSDRAAADRNLAAAFRRTSRNSTGVWRKRKGGGGLSLDSRPDILLPWQLADQAFQLKAEQQAVQGVERQFCLFGQLFNIHRSRTKRGQQGLFRFR